MSDPEATPLDTFIAALKAINAVDRAAVIERFDYATPEEIRELLRLRKQRTIKASEATPISDVQLLDWLQEQAVDVIYLDDGRIIDVSGNCVRAAIRAAMGRHAGKG